MVPQVESGSPAAGKRVLLQAPEYKETQIFHSVYLPIDWKSKQPSTERYPVVVEYTGNFHPPSGSTGRVSNASLGYGICGGDAIWIVLPTIAADGCEPTTTWFGDITATVQYAKTNVPRLCKQFGGDPNKVVLCGFSRGAIAVSFLGLHDDEISDLWSGFVTHDHFDGLKSYRGTPWGYPLQEYQAAATERLRRIGDRPFLVCQNPNPERTIDFLRSRISIDSFGFLAVNTHSILGEFPNQIAVHPHTDRCLNVDSEARRRVWRWFARVTGTADASNSDEAFRDDSSHDLANPNQAPR